MNGGAKSAQHEQSSQATKSPQNGDSASKKKLSGATMGMRFMQRKKEAEAARQQIVNEQKQQQDNNDMEWTATNNNDASAAQGSDAVEEPDMSLTSQTGATPSDMFGAKSDLIGRRSFGGFRPRISETYKSACQAYEHGTSINDSKKHVSDEELLRRYKSYVTGKEEAAPIGNLQEKLKKRKSSSLQNKSGKKKR
jgi:hypothetical protein